MSDLVGGERLRSCPYAASTVPPPSSSSPPSLPSPLLLRVHSPAVSAVFGAAALLLVASGFAAILRFNSVYVFNRSIKHPSVRNSVWAAFFFVLGLACSLEAIRYATDLVSAAADPPRQSPSSDPRIVDAPIVDAWLLISASFLRIVAIMLLSLALDFQLRHRSPGEQKQPMRSVFLPAMGYRERRNSSISIETPPTNAIGQRPQFLSPTLSATNSSRRIINMNSSISSIDERFDLASETMDLLSSDSEVEEREDSAGTAGEDEPLFHDADLASSGLLSSPPGNVARRRGSADSATRSVIERLRIYSIAALYNRYAVIFGLCLAHILSLYLLVNPTIISPETASPTNTTWMIPPPLLVNISQSPSPLSLRMHLIVTAFHFIPTFVLSAMIIISKSGQQTQQHRTRRRSITSTTTNEQPPHVPRGPTASMRALLAVAVLGTVILLVEPSHVASLLMRNYAPHTATHPCIVPPWWWVDVDVLTRGASHAGTHGWATIVDFTIFVGGLCAGVGGLFAFMWGEFVRERDEWVWECVSRVRDLFFPGMA